VAKLRNDSFLEVVVNIYFKKRLFSCGQSANPRTNSFIVIIIIIIIIIIITTFMQGIYVKQTMFLGYIFLQLFCSYNVCYIYVFRP
jgi:hypothetical protein